MSLTNSTTYGICMIMPELANVKHEQFCHELLKAPSQKDAYLATIPGVTDKTATSNSSRLLRNADVKERFYELLRGSGVDLGTISNRYARWLNDDQNPTQSWDAVKTGLKIYGVLDADDKQSAPANIQVNIVQLTGDSTA